jgi:hypothetical protein
MSGLTLPKEYRQLCDDLEEYTYVDHLYLVYGDTGYLGLARTDTQALAMVSNHAKPTIYEVDKPSQTSVRVY